ncbi:MAG TPA: heme exporter protein CcmB [Steroidobacteraceae bacterium]|jgi:heme exporter protein B|nr:heme exporter protein CcmB [Steroidobacteraceae bacterium]
MNAQQERVEMAAAEPQIEGSGLGRAVVGLARRDLRVALRRSGDTLQPLGFFVIVTTLFPLALQPEVSLLRDIAPAALWVGALLASLLALDLLFREDAQDGTLEQLALCGQPLASLVLAKTAVHWLLTGLPLVLVAPLAALALGVPAAALPAVLAALVLGSVTLSLIGAVGAGLTMGMRRNGSLLAMLVLPLVVPVLIFGAQATAHAISGEKVAAPLYLLAAMAVLAVTLAPFAVAAAVRIGLE